MLFPQIAYWIVASPTTALNESAIQALTQLAYFTFLLVFVGVAYAAYGVWRVIRLEKVRMRLSGDPPGGFRR